MEAPKKRARSQSPARLHADQPEYSPKLRSRTRTRSTARTREAAGQPDAGGVVSTAASPTATETVRPRRSASVANAPRTNSTKSRSSSDHSASSQHHSDGPLSFSSSSSSPSTSSRAGTQQQQQASRFQPQNRREQQQQQQRYVSQTDAEEDDYAPRHTKHHHLTKSSLCRLDSSDWPSGVVAIIAATYILGLLVAGSAVWSVTRTTAAADAVPSTQNPGSG